MALWGGRFEMETDELMREFSSSLAFDQRLWLADIRASLAHVKMLGEQKILSPSDTEKIISGLNEIREDLLTGKAQFNPDAEDVHGEIERLLIEKIGEPAKRMHTARSRNDQVSTSTRLYLKEQIEILSNDLIELQRIIVNIAESHVETILPGMTHLQHAQPVSLAHHLLAYFWMFERDKDRFHDAERRIMASPLGAAALAGSGFPITRERTAKDLGFTSVMENSLDAVSDRDFVLEFLSHAAICMMHLSRLCEELILWSTPEFSFVELSEKVTTGSSIMPQKKNPDAAELIRGRTGRVFGALVGALTMMKALPLSYNRDMQEDKIHLFSSLDTLRVSIRLMSLVLKTAEWKVDRMAAAVKGDFSNATDLADDLAEKGVPFREAHEVVGQVVRDCIKDRIALEELSLEQLRHYHPRFDEVSKAKLDPIRVLSARNSFGGTAPKRVREQIELAKSRLNQ